MSDTLPRIRSVEVTGPATLVLTWVSGGTVRVDLSGWIAGGGDILAPLTDPNVFATARVGEHGASIEWGGDDDLAIDAEHLSGVAVTQRIDLSRP